MFGSKPVPAPSNKELDTLIAKATDSNLTADNWEYIMEICDKISSDPEDATVSAALSLGQRLSSKDANVNLRSLSLLLAMAENCGSRMKQVIATKQFLSDNILKKMADRKVHPTVKQRIAEVIDQLAKSFKNDPSLKPMQDALNTINKNYSQYLTGPSKPSKKQITQGEKVREEEELQRALQLSLDEYERAQNSTKNSAPMEQNQQSEQPNSVKADSQSQTPPPQTIATVSKVRALYDLISYEPDELSFRKGDVITVIESVYRDWWRGSLPNGKIGIFPLNYVTPLVTKSADQLRKEAEAEARILADTRKVDHLLALLSNPSNVDEAEITRLYNEIVPLRPQLGQFIEKYSVRKEELMQLKHQMDSETKQYNELMDAQIQMRTQPSGQSQVPYPFTSFMDNNKLMQQPTSSGFGNYNDSQQTHGVPEYSYQPQHNHHDGAIYQSQGQNQPQSLQSHISTPQSPQNAHIPQGRGYHPQRIESQPNHSGQYNYANSHNTGSQEYTSGDGIGPQRSHPYYEERRSSQNLSANSTNFPQILPGAQRTSSQQFSNISKFPEVESFN